jgi:hypothetical protein
MKNTPNLVAILASLCLLLCVPTHTLGETSVLARADIQEITWLTRAVIAEIGWGTTKGEQEEQILIAFILDYRYDVRRQNNPKETLTDSTRAYCRGLQKDRVRLTRRMLWIRHLPAPTDALLFPTKQPKFWPKTAPWSKMSLYYKETWLRMKDWREGKFEHPCPGAKHWGHPKMDKRPKGMRVLSCSKRFKNRIYG